MTQITGNNPASKQPGVNGSVSHGSKPRIIMVAGQFWPLVGGAEIQCQRLASELTRIGYDVRVLTGRHQAEIPKQETIDGVPVVRFGMLRVNKLRNLSVLLALAWALWRLRSSYDIIHAHQALRHAAVASFIGRLLRKPVLVKASSGGGGSDIIRMKQRVYGDWFSLFDPLLWRLILWCNIAIAVSTEARDELIEAGFGAGRVFNIPNGVPLSCAAHDTPAESDTKLVNVLCVAGLRPIKGIDVLLQSAAQADGLHINILGDGYQLRELTALKDKLGLRETVTFHGQRADVDLFLSRAEIYVCPSRAEGMSNALLEAMACGLPCIATAVEGNRDAIQNGVNGLLVDPEDAGALADALNKLSTDKGLRKTLGEQARKTVKDRYDINTTAMSIGELYSRLFAGDSRS